MKYACEECGAEGVKLWRRVAVMMEASEPLCLLCVSGRDPGVDHNRVRADGTVDGATDQIAGRLPAVPSPDGSFWGYTSVPESGVRWWRALPLRRDAIDMCNHHMENALALAMRGEFTKAVLQLDEGAMWRWRSEEADFDIRWVLGAYRFARYMEDV